MVSERRSYGERCRKREGGREGGQHLQIPGADVDVTVVGGDGEHAALLVPDVPHLEALVGGGGDEDWGEGGREGGWEGKYEFFEGLVTVIPALPPSLPPPLLT